MTSPKDLVIIGSGPAGYTAAIYAGRAALEPVVIEGTLRGGALMQTTHVENFPGFVEGVQGPELIELLRKQAQRYGAQLIPADVTAIALGAKPSAHTMSPIHRIEVEDTAGYEMNALILAMGSSYRRLEIPGEARLAGRGVSWCATCDGFFFRNQHIAVVGGGDSALEEATFLTRFAASVTVIHRRDSLRASKIMQQRAFADQKITFCWNCEVIEILGEDQVAGIVLRDNLIDRVSTRAVTGVFVAIGHEPRNELVRGQLDLDAEGYVQTNDGSTRTSRPGVFACGDLVDHTYRQAITAAASGCAAGLDAESYLSRINFDRRRE
jgi:thioredoxin reductase (NADPH)